MSFLSQIVSPSLEVGRFRNGSVYCCRLTELLQGLHGFNTSNISGILAMTDFIKTFRLTSYSATEYSNISGWVTSVIVLGGLGGALTASLLNDRLGRPKTLWLMGLIYLLAASSRLQL